MSDSEEKNEDLYGVLGLEKECTDSELRNAYKKLAKRWHPDRCAAPGNSKCVEEAKTKFQEIQQAYSVLSDVNKRFLYDVGAYDDDDDDSNNGMGDFLKEMAVMMSQTKAKENGKEESFENLQVLFNEMLQGDVKGVGISTQTMESSACSTSSYVSYVESSVSNKRNSSEMNMGTGESFFDSYFQNAHLEVKQWQEIEKGKEVGGGSFDDGSSSNRRQGRQQKVSSGHDVSSNSSYSGVSA